MTRKTPEQVVADQAWYFPWEARLRASWTKPQHVQNRVMDRYVAAVRERDLEWRKAEAQHRAHLAAEALRMREYRARRRAAKQASGGRVDRLLQVGGPHSRKD